MHDDWSATFSGSVASPVSRERQLPDTCEVLERPGVDRGFSKAPPAPIGADEDAAELPECPRWSDLWGLFRRKRLLDRGRPKREVESMDGSAALFARAVGDPALAAIGEATLLAYAAWLGRRKWRGKPLAGTTIAKHLTQIGTVLRYGGPRSGSGARCKRTACRCGLLTPPVLCSDDWPRIVKRTKGTLLVPQITAWIDASSLATRPRIRHVSAKNWWAALLVWLRNTGMRVEETLELRWAWLEGPWVTVPADSRKGRAAEHRLYANRWARAAAWRIRTASDLVFGYSGQRNNINHLVRMYAPSPAMRLHRLRATLATDLIAAKHEMVARMQLGHRGGVTQEFYAHFERLAPEVLEDEAILVQPDLRWDPAYQRFLLAVVAPEPASRGCQPGDQCDVLERPGVKRGFSEAPPAPAPDDPWQLRLFSE